MYKDDYLEEYNLNNKNNKVNYKNIFISIIIVFILLIIYLIIKKNNNNSPITNNNNNGIIYYAQQYIKNNNLNIISDSYLYANEIGYKLYKNCSELSGVIVFKDKTYKENLICSNKEKTKLNNTNLINLKGEDIIFVSENNPYIELGYDSNYKVNVLNNFTNNNANLIEYEVISGNTILEKAKRFVIKINDNLYNNNFPKIELNGDKELFIELGEEYKELGYNAIDNEEGIITNKVEVINNINNNQEGIYEIIYKVENNKGFNSTTKRIVNVINNEEINAIHVINPDKPTNDNKIITINISSNNYDYTLLPDGSKEKEYTFNYIVKENGNYVFRYYDKKGEYKEEVIEIDGIDRESPLLTCNAITYNKYTEIKSLVQSNDVSNYKYIVNGNDYGFVNSNSFNANIGKAINVYVIAKDIAGNETKQECVITKKIIEVSEQGNFPYTINNSKRNLSCGIGPNSNSNLYNFIKGAGYKTREGVVAAGLYLSSLYEYKIPYFWSGGHSHSYSFKDFGNVNDKGNNFIGINKYWGCSAKMAFGGTDKQKNGVYYPFGIDCSGFINWAIQTGGYFTGDNNQNIYISTGNTPPGSISGISITVSNKSNTRGRVKAGDIAWKKGHVGLVIGITQSNIYVAEEAGYNSGMIIKTYGYNNSGFTHILLMDNFYSNYGKGKELWEGFK